MTKKQKLATEYLELKKQFDGEDFKPGITEHQMWYLTSEFKVADLEYKIEAVRRAIAEHEKKSQVEAFYNTPDGQAYKKEHTNKKNEIIDNRRRIINEFNEWVKTLINDTCEGKWVAKAYFSYNRCNIEFGLENPEKPGEALFGHTAEITYEGANEYAKSLYGAEDRFTMNYPTYGTFDLLSDPTRGKYLMGLGTLATNKLFLETVNERLRKDTEAVENLGDAIDEENKLLENPKI